MFALVRVAYWWPSILVMPSRPACADDDDDVKWMVMLLLMMTTITVTIALHLFKPVLRTKNSGMYTQASRSSS